MSGPDFEAVLDPHWRTDCSETKGGNYFRWVLCRCGWESEKSRSLINIPDMHRVWNAHLSAALHAEHTRWLGDEGTREVVALTLFADEQVARHESVEHRWDTTLSDDDRNEYRNLAAAAVAALTTTEAGQ